MAQTEARAWWADVQHLRDDYERTDEARRRADEADLASRRETRERRGIDAEISTLHSPRRDRADTRQPARHGAEQARAPRRGQPLAVSSDPSSRLADPSPAEPGRPHVKGSGAPGRATIEIRGRTVPAPAVPRTVDLSRRRPPRRPVERVGARPDRVAMWALMMGLLLILVALGTADGPAVISLTLR